MPAWPSLTIITPTEGRFDELSEMLLSASKARTKYPGASEHIIVDSSESVLENNVRMMCENTGTIYLKSDSQNVRKKRNIACAQAKGELLVFIDSDVIVHEDCFVRHIEALGEAPGTLGSMYFVGNATIWNRMMESCGFTNIFKFAEHSAKAWWGFTANAMIRKSCFESVGGFAVNMPSRLGGDDLDLTLRVTQIFGPLVCAPLAKCAHSRVTWGTAKGAFSRAWRWGRMEYHLMCKHSDFCVEAPLRFWVFSIIAMFSFIVLCKANLIFVATLTISWFVLSLTLFEVLMEGSALRIMRQPLTVIGQAVFELLFELGSIFESIRHGSFIGLGMSLVPGGDGIENQHRASSINVRANIIAWLVTFSVGWLLWT